MMTRYPQNPVDVANCGDDGDTAAGFMSKRFKYEVQEKEPIAAFVCFGANDGGYTIYPDADDTTKAQKISEARNNLEKVIKGLKEEGVEDITLLTPVTYDDRESFETTITNRLGYGDATALIAVNVLALAEEYDLKVVDTNTVTNAILEANKDSGVEEIFQTDRIHPNTRGHFVIASKIIETLYGADSIVASVDIDAGDLDFYAENADVSAVRAEDGTLSYRYKPYSLPMGIDNAGYKAVHERYGDYVNFTDSMNNEIIRITNLADGDYTISFDGVTIGQYSAQDLAEGINIATNPLNPGQIAAKEVIDMLMTNVYTFQKVRILEIVEGRLKNAGMFYDTTFEEQIDWLSKNDTYYMSTFKECYPVRSQLITLTNNVKKSAHAKAQPTEHIVTITPVAQ